MIEFMIYTGALVMILVAPLVVVIYDVTKHEPK